jgi:hypothetical protein
VRFFATAVAAPGSPFVDDGVAPFGALVLFVLLQAAKSSAKAVAIPSRIPLSIELRGKRESARTGDIDSFTAKPQPPTSSTRQFALTELRSAVP